MLIMAEMSAAPAIGVPVAQVVGVRDVLITDESQPATRDGHTARDRRYCGGRLSRKSCILVSAVSVLLLVALRAAAAADWGDAESVPGARAVLDAIASF